MLHRHHKIPKHMGGTDNPENIVMLTIEEHAEAHRKLYEKYGKWQDKLAWLGLSHQIDLADIKRIAIVEGGRKGGSHKKVRSAEYHIMQATIRERKTKRRRPDRVSKTGRHCTAAHKAAVSAAKMGKPRSKEAKLAISKSHSIRYKVTDPTGKAFVVNNLPSFCRHHKLNRGALWGVAAKRRTHHKQWRCEFM